MKTAIQEWFDELRAEYPYLANTLYKRGFKKYLEKEKEQIENAYSEGYSDGVQEPNPNEEYYNQTYSKSNI